MNVWIGGLAGRWTDSDSTSVVKMGWSGIKNGRLLALAVENGFQIFLTGDRNLSFQQNISELRLAVIVLAAKGVRLVDTLPLMPKVLALLPDIKPGQVIIVT